MVRVKKEKKTQPQSVDRVNSDASTMSGITDKENRASNEQSVSFSSRVTTSKEQGVKKKPRTLSKKSGLILPALKIYQSLKKGNYADKIGKGKKVEANYERKLSFCYHKQALASTAQQLSNICALRYWNWLETLLVTTRKFASRLVTFSWQFAMTKNWISYALASISLKVESSQTFTQFCSQHLPRNARLTRKLINLIKNMKKIKFDLHSQFRQGRTAIKEGQSLEGSLCSISCSWTFSLSKILMLIKT